MSRPFLFTAILVSFFACSKGPGDVRDFNLHIQTYRSNSGGPFGSSWLAGQTIVIEKNGQHYQTITTDIHGSYDIRVRESIYELDEIVVYFVSNDSLYECNQVFRFTSDLWLNQAQYAYELDADFFVDIYTRVNFRLKNITPFDVNDMVDTFGLATATMPSGWQYNFPALVLNLQGMNVDTIISRRLPRRNLDCGLSFTKNSNPLRSLFSFNIDIDVADTTLAIYY